MGSIGEINEKIKEKLTQFGMASFDELDEKTLKRLYEIESCISDMEVTSRELEKKLKTVQPNITRIISSDKVSITKKTAYNNPIIIQYMTMSIEKFPDLFNENKIKKLEENYINLNDMYNKVIDNIIDDYNKEHENILLLDEINVLNRQIGYLKEIINEKNQEILKAKRNNKVINFKNTTEGK